MCGRYAATANPDELVEEFEISFVDEEMAEVCRPRFNIAPTDTVAAVVERLKDDETTRKLVPLRWGLVPSWAKAPTATMINARVETVTQKPAFRKAASARRCLLPAIGYYEWRKEEVEGSAKPIKQPYFLSPEGGPLVMAGLYEFWKDPGLAGEGAWLTTCTIITTQATDALGHIHDRMPMTVLPGDWDAWLDPRLTDAEGVRPLLHAPHGAEVETYAVVPLVNNVRNDGPELLQPLR